MQPQHPRSSPATSDLLANRYVLEEQIAVGGLAAVWRAHDEVLARTVALKLLHDDLSRDPDIRDRFRREAVAAAKLVHPGIVSLYDTGLDGARVYLVIEYIDGHTLAEALQHEPMEPHEAARIGLRVASALAYAHDRGVVHRDIKPANILLTAEGHVKVTDFGIAKATHESSLSLSEPLAVSSAYIAPEQLTDEPVDGRADLYSLGLVMYEMLTGRAAFGASDASDAARFRVQHDQLHARRIRADVPRSLDEVVANLTALDPADRPQDAKEVVELLRPFEPDQAIPTIPSDTDDTTVESIGAELRWLFPVAALLVLAGGLVGVGLLQGPVDIGQIVSLPAEEVTSLLLATPEVEPEPDPEITPQPVEIAGVRAYDPAPGDGTERDRFLDDVTDGDTTTFWATERYDTAALGNLKRGVGFYVDLGQPVAIAEISLNVPRGGFDVEFRLADRVDNDPERWDTAVLAINDIAEGANSYPLTGSPRAQFVLVWITGDLLPFEGQFRAEVAEIEVRALAS